jgi:hypothetical protein
MSCLGVHFALNEDDVAKLRSFEDEQDRLDHVKEVLEPLYFEKYPELKAESDKAWDAMHRALADGEMTWDSGSYPLNHAILAGELLYTESDYIMSMKSPKQVQDIATALAAVSEADFRKRYFAIDANSYGAPVSEEDFSYTWDWFQGVRELYAHAAKAGRYVLFTADQ